jgi:hypothetical protein
MVSEQIFSREDAHSPATIAMHQEKFSSEVCSNILERQSCIPNYPAFDPPRLGMLLPF